MKRQLKSLLTTSSYLEKLVLNKPKQLESVLQLPGYASLTEIVRQSDKCQTIKGILSIVEIGKQN